MSKSTKALLASYGRSVLAGASALYMSGVTDPKDLIWSLVAAIAPVALRFFNPNDSAFGVLPSVDEVKEILTSAKLKKAPAKKAAKKK